MSSLDSLIDIPPICSNDKWKTGEYNLSHHYSSINLSTIRHIDELITERRDNPSLRDKNYLTGDFLIYYTENNLPKLAITRVTHNPLFQTEKIAQLSEDFMFSSIWHGLPLPYEKWFWQQRKLKKALTDPQTTIIDLTKIHHTYTEGMVDYLCINPKNKTAYFRNFYNYEPEQRTPIVHEHPLQVHYKQQGTHCDYDTYSFSDEDTKLLHRLFGSPDSFNQNMDSLAHTDILYLKIQLISIKDVITYTKNNAIGHFLALKPLSQYSDINCMNGSHQILTHNYIRAQPKKVE